MRNKKYLSIKQWNNLNNINGLIVASGTFDIIHFGHISYLSFAKKQGNKLLVGINSDSLVTKMKGKPIFSFKYRYKVVSAIAIVDYIIKIEEGSNFFDIVKPQFYVKGGDYKNIKSVDVEIARNAGVKVLYSPYLKGFSTKKIKKNTC